MPGYDPAARRRSVRTGRERGCWVYVPAEELELLGFAKGDPPPFYNLTALRRRSVALHFYAEERPPARRPLQVVRS